MKKLINFAILIWFFPYVLFNGVNNIVPNGNNDPISNIGETIMENTRSPRWEVSMNHKNFGLFSLMNLVSTQCGGLVFFHLPLGKWEAQSSEFGVEGEENFSPNSQLSSQN